jgi:hypothetical protein
MPKLLRDRLAGNRIVKRWRFGLRTLFVVMVIVGIGLGLFARWWFTPMVLYRSGGEAWYQRDSRGRLRHLRTVEYYSSGKKWLEYGPGRTNLKVWAPDGTLVSEDEALFSTWELATDAEFYGQ